MALKQHQVGRLIIIGVVILASWLMVRASLWAASEAIETQATANPIGSSFIYRFDPNTQTFVTITLPADSLPSDLQITGTNPVHAWFTDFRRHSLGHLVYTNTLNYALTELPVTSTTNSGPYRLTLIGQHVWFTERGANRVGRLNTMTGVVDEFYDNGLSLNGNLADLEVAPNGWVWIAAPGSKRVVQLTVTSTQVYAFHEYTDTYRPDFPVTPQYLAVEDNDSIWMTMPGRPTFQLARLRPSIESFDYATAPALISSLRQIIVLSGDVWTANFGNNTLDQGLIGTSPYLIHRIPISSPVGLAISTPGTFWVTQGTTPPALARVIYTNTNNTFNSVTYSMPGTNAIFSSLAVGEDGGVWVTAYNPYRRYLPLIAKQ